MCEAQEIYHVMTLEVEHPDGSQEWACPACGRRFRMWWPPEYQRVILVEGDLMVEHSGGIGGVQMGKSLIIPPSLEPFERYMEQRSSMKEDGAQ